MRDAGLVQRDVALDDLVVDPGPLLVSLALVWVAAAPGGAIAAETITYLFPAPPLLPARSASQVVSTSLPTGVTRPMPVIATRRRSTLHLDA